MTDIEPRICERCGDSFGPTVAPSGYVEHWTRFVRRRFCSQECRRGGDASTRFLSQTRRDESGCWIWTGSTNGKYGKFCVDGRFIYAHRWSYEHHVAPIPEGLQIDHLCRNVLCVNPAHLEPVTCQENLLRRPPQTAARPNIYLIHEQRRRARRLREGA